MELSNTTITFEDKKDALYLFPILAKGKPVEYALI